MSIKLDSLEWNNIADPNGSAEPRFNFSKDAAWLTNSCYQLSGSNYGMYRFIQNSGQLKSFDLDWNNPTFILVLDGFEKDKKNSGECYFNSDGADGDDHHETASITLDLRNLLSPDGRQLPPGISSQVQYVGTDNTHYGAYFKVRYWVTSPPGQPTRTSAQAPGNICSQENVTIKTNVNLTYKPGLQYVWEYHYKGEFTYKQNPNLQTCMDNCYAYADPNTYPDCSSCYTDYPPTIAETWTQLAVTSTDFLTFNPANTVFGPYLSENTSLEFRVKAKTAEVESSWSPVSTFHFSPPAPNLNNVSITYDKACPDQATGTIHVSGISGVGQYIYILREGHYNTATCNPEKDQSEGGCLGNPYSGKVSQNNFDIQNIKAGPYTLWITNPGGNLGVCNSIIDTITVPEYPRLVLNAPVPKPVDCHGKQTGSFIATSSGGIAAIKYQLSGSTLSQPIEQTVAAPGTSYEFTGLSAGAYTLTVSDGCNQVKTQPVRIEQPAKVNIQSYIITPASCASPGDGQISVQATFIKGAYDKDFSQNYAFQLYKDGTIYKEITSTSNDSWTVTDLPVSSNYQLLVKDASGNLCSGETLSFSILPPVPLSITKIQSIPVSCFGGSDGQISVTDNGLPDPTTQYRYVLKKGTTLIEDNQDGVFTGLSADSYSVTKIRNITGCQDAYTTPDIIITQPTVISITYSKNDVTCFEAQNGQITATVSGGTKPYTYQWQLLLGTNPDEEQDWSDLSGKNNFTINNLSPGTYRLQVKDSSACQIKPSIVTITEPALLQITSVYLHDIVCFGNNGSLEPVVRGGTAPYMLEYSTDNWKSYISFTSATALAAGNYQLRATDQNGCVAYYEPTLTITSPPAELAFSYTLSDYNGFHISCYGNNNGSAILSATGGNGSSYTGYSYALDEGAFQASPMIHGITAGIHTLHVKDARGCILSKEIAFSQPDAALSLQLGHKTDIVCYGKTTGEVFLNVTGGTGPYRFSLNGNTFQSSAAFTSLAAGNYTLTVKDINECAVILPVSLIHLYKPITITATITDVSCFDGDDGHIQVVAGGGNGNYHYEWTSLQKTGTMISKLKVGSYAVRITDGTGCRKDTVFVVKQPRASLQVYVHNTPVCADRKNGVINLSPRGGTPPYQYSIDNGISYQATTLFQVGVGTYSIVVSDSKGCTVKASTTIIQRNDKPEPKFLVATQRSALDTLIIKETSLPRPDSIYWTFDSRAIVIDADAYSPKIRFTDPGTYPITMTGYFGGCDYSLTKTLHLAPLDREVSKTPVPGSIVFRELSVTPNPNDGNFHFTVKLSQPETLSIIIVDVLGNEHYRKNYSKIEEITEELQLKLTSSGFYILRAIVPTDAREARILLNKQ